MRTEKRPECGYNQLKFGILRAAKWRGTHQSQAGKTLDFDDIVGGEVVSQRDHRSGHLQVMCANHLAAPLQVRPEAHMAAGWLKIKG